MLARRFSLGLLAALAVACSSSDDGATNGMSDAATDAANDAAPLPTEFGDCSSPPCEVALEAFTKNPGTTPYCESSKDALDLSCPTAEGAQTGTCDGLFAVRFVYAFTGDFYECAYDAASGKLVGAKWSPDNHPTQIAGQQVPADCQLVPVCSSASDAGAG